MSGETLSLVEQCNKLRKDFELKHSELSNNPISTMIETLRLDYLGKKGSIPALLTGMKDCEPALRKESGQQINILKNYVNEKLAELKKAAQQHNIASKLKNETIDISLPTQHHFPSGSLHPVTLTRMTLQREFRKLGFTVYDGPEIDSDFYNFSALNIPDYHPARDMQDTFYINNGESFVLRTHTSNIQIHAMTNNRPPLRIVGLGKTFRCESDATHTPMFHQVEGFIIDEGINFANLKGIISTLLTSIYGKNINTRFRPSYFPFVEPGAEMDIECFACKGAGCSLCKGTGWMELGGCGMIHPNVIENVGYDSEIYTGFAFGFGIDRIAMNRYQVNDLRLFFENDFDFLSQFPTFSN